MEKKNVRIWANRSLIDKIKGVFPETKGLTYSGVVDFALRLLLKYEKQNRKKEGGK